MTASLDTVPLIWCERWRCRLREEVCIERHLQPEVADGLDLWAECRSCAVGAKRAREGGRAEPSFVAGGGASWYTRRMPQPAPDRPPCLCGCGRPARISRGPRPCKFASTECAKRYTAKRSVGRRRS